MSKLLASFISLPWGHLLAYIKDKIAEDGLKIKKKVLKEELRKRVVLPCNINNCWSNNFVVERNNFLV